jgi:group II intron reverse transcriptase/maturase
MAGTPSPETISTRQLELAKRAERVPDEALLTLSHFIDLDWLREAYHRTRKDGAAGVDGQVAADYEVDLDANLSRLLERFKTGRYRAPPVKRVYIPKGDGKRLRPIGIPTLEDKVLQRAVVMLLEPIYEQSFSDCSYGFRPGRSAHQALDDLWRQMMSLSTCWLIELDIESFFDRVDRALLQEMVARRVGDGVIRRVIGKWLRAGVLEGTQLSYPKQGTPQGGVISPMLANIYLHEVLDQWFEEDVKPRLKERAFMIRYADDAVLGFEQEEDAERVFEVLPKRFAKYALTLHPEKTRLLPFHKPGPNDRPRGGPGQSRSFDFLGFTLYWGRSRKGNWVVRRKTAKDRLSRALRAVEQWCRRHRHAPVTWQHERLSRKLRGHYAYYGMTGNGRSLASFRHHVERIWRKWLRRRSNAKLPWSRFSAFLQRSPLPPARIVHSVYRRPAMS